MILREVASRRGFTWWLKIPTWGSMWMGLPTFYTVVVDLNPPTGVNRQHESREAQSLYPLALQLARALRLEFVGRAT
jgi:hypothetical protein